jgi:hypothetical protein
MASFSDILDFVSGGRSTTGTQAQSGTFARSGVQEQGVVQESGKQTKQVTNTKQGQTQSGSGTQQQTTQQGLTGTTQNIDPAVMEMIKNIMPSMAAGADSGAQVAALANLQTSRAMGADAMINDVVEKMKTSARTEFAEQQAPQVQTAVNAIGSEGNSASMMIRNMADSNLAAKIGGLEGNIRMEGEKLVNDIVTGGLQAANTGAGALSSILNSIKGGTITTNTEATGTANTGTTQNLQTDTTTENVVQAEELAALKSLMDILTQESGSQASNTDLFSRQTGSLPQILQALGSFAN